jgi:uncharacterized protein involved in outer membrane biogenesis
VKSVLRYVVIAGGIIAALALALVLLPWNALRGPVAAYAAHVFQRPVTIGGDLDVELGRPLRVTLDDVSIGNVEWSQHQPMARARRVVLHFGLASLLRGEPDHVELAGPIVILERNRDGAANWHFGDDDVVPVPDSIAVDAGELRYLDPTVDADIRLELQSVKGGADAAPGLEITGKGTLHGEALSISGRGHGLAALSDTARPYRLAIEARAGRTRMRFDGAVVPAEPENVRGTLHLRGPDLSRLYPIVPSPLPWTPAYDLQGELAHTKDRWIFRGIKGSVGQSDLAGDLEIDVSTPRAKTIADLTSARFDYRDLGGFVGLPPGETALRAEVERRGPTGRVLSDRAFDLAKLRALDADVKFRGSAVRFGDIPLDNLVARLQLENGVLRFNPLDFGVADGHLVSNVRLDATPAVPQARGEIEIRRLELKRIFPKLASPQGTAGRFGGRAKFDTRGNSMAAMFARVNGEAAVIMRGGEASTLQLALTNIDLARAAELLLLGDRTAEVRCAVAALHARDGVVTPDLLVVDTSEVVIDGEGTIDLRNETYDLQLTAKSKRPSLLALRGPVVLGGTLGNPDVRPAVGPVAARVGAAVGLGAVAPPLALLPLIDPGGASDVDCRSLVEQARVQTGTTARIPRPKAKPRDPTQAEPRRAAREKTPQGG